MSVLPIVYDGVRQPELDIVSIPGLPRLSPHYKLRDHNQWLREVLSHQIPKARIMAFQYDFCKSSAPNWRALLEPVLSLLYNLLHRREGVDSRPIIFVCSSFGSFILKKALLLSKERYEFRSIIECTGGIIFLGCLHDEKHPDFEDLCLKCAAVEFGINRKHNTIEALRKADDWNIIKEITEGFRNLNVPFQVRGFFERRPTTFQVGRLSVRKTENLCPGSISSLGWDNEKCRGIQADHTELTSFPRRIDDEYFDCFMNTLLQIVEHVCQKSDGAETREVAEVTDMSEEWAILDNLAASTSNLSIASEADMPPLTSRASIRTVATTRRRRPEPKIPCYVTTPYEEENEYFTGRQNILDEVHQALKPVSSQKEPRTFAITGLGGMGKTQIAISYAFRHRDTYRVILWAHTDGQSKLAESFIHFAVELGLCDPDMNNPSVAKQAVKECLRDLDVNWLLIFDNADGEDKEMLLQEHWPKATRGSILITSRDHKLIGSDYKAIGHLPGIDLTVLDESSAANLLLSLTHVDQEQLLTEEMRAVKRIVKRIDYLPLGISQAANLILNDSLTFGAFLEAYSNRELIEDSEEVKLVNEGATYQYSLRTVWNMNFDRLRDNAPSLINLMSYLDPDRIQMRLLDAATRAQDEMLAFIDTPYKRNKCRSALLKSSLVSQSEKFSELRMHRLVQASCHLRQKPEERRNSFKSAVILVKTVWPVPPRDKVHNPSLWKDQQAFLPHVQSLCAHYVASCQKNEPLIPHDTVDWDFASVLYEAGWYCYERGLLESVEDILIPAEQYCLRNLENGGGYRILADVYGGIGSLHTESNNFQGAYDCFSKQWDYLQLAFEHGELKRPSIWEVFGLGRLGNGLQGLQRFEEAEKFYRLCLKTWEALPGDRKIFTTHLGTCLWLQGKPDEAEHVLQTIIKDREDTTNFRTGQALFALGNVQIAQAQALTADGRKEEAEAKFRDAMETHMQSYKLYSITLGERHHKTADAMHKVGWHLHRKCLYDKALAMFDSALDIYTSSPQLFKNEIARTKYKRGCTYQDLGDGEKGKAEIREAENMRQEIVPPETWEPAKSEEDFNEIVQFWTR